MYVPKLLLLLLSKTLYSQYKTGWAQNKCSRHRCGLTSGLSLNNFTIILSILFGLCQCTFFFSGKKGYGPPIPFHFFRQCPSVFAIGKMKMGYGTPILVYLQLSSLICNTSLKNWTKSLSFSRFLLILNCSYAGQLEIIWDCVSMWVQCWHSHNSCWNFLSLEKFIFTVGTIELLIRNFNLASITFSSLK